MMKLPLNILDPELGANDANVQAAPIIDDPIDTSKSFKNELLLDSAISNPYNCKIILGIDRVMASSFFDTTSP